MGMLEKWEASIRRLEVEYKEKMSDGLKAGILLEMMPATVTEVMTQRIKEEDDYATVKECLLRYIETKAYFGGTAPVDVDNLNRLEIHEGQQGHLEQEGHHEEHGDVNALGKGAGGKGGYGHKGGGSNWTQFHGTCNICGAWGHKAAQCPTKVSCWHCGAQGHRVAQCPVKDAEMKGKGKGMQNGKGYFDKGNSKGEQWKGDGKGKGPGPYGKGKGKYGKGYSWDLKGLWENDEDNAETENAQDAWSLSLFNLSESQALVIKHDTLPPPPEPTWEKVTPSRSSRGKRQRTPTLPKCSYSYTCGERQQTNPFSILGCLTENDEDKTEIWDEKNIKDVTGELHALFDHDQELHYVPKGPKWTRIESVMGSGAAESVAPLSMAPWIDAEESDGSRRGQTYMSASGEKLPNLGEKQLDVVTSEGKTARATFQCADVTRALCAVSKICDKGNKVIFEASGGYIESANGQRTKFRRENNVHVLEMYSLAAEGPELAHQSGFNRQSAW